LASEGAREQLKKEWERRVKGWEEGGQGFHKEGLTQREGDSVGEKDISSGFLNKMLLLLCTIANKKANAGGILEKD